MSQLNYKVGVEGKSAEQVAKEFLQEQGLLERNSLKNVKTQLC